MTTIKKTFTVFSLIFLFQCNQPGIGDLNSKNMTGKEAREKLVKTASFYDTLSVLAAIGSSRNSTSIRSLVTAINNALVPIVANIKDSEYYEADSVNSCVKKIQSFIFFADGFITIGLTCDIKKAKFLDTP